jgi:hypothetical protein
VAETCFYKAPGTAEVFRTVYQGAMYLQTGAGAGSANITVTITHPGLEQPLSEMFPVTVKPQLSGIAVLTSNISEAGLLDGLFGSGICNWSAQLRTGRSLTLKPYIYNIDEIEHHQSGTSEKSDGFENSFDNIYPVAADKVSWRVHVAAGERKMKRYVKLDRKTGKVTFRKKVSGRDGYAAGPRIDMKYRGVEASYNISGISGPNKFTSLFVYKPSRALLLRGEQRVLRPAFPVLQRASGRLRWSSSDRRVAGIDSLGIARAKAIGPVSFTAAFGGKKSKSDYSVVSLETFMREYYVLGVKYSVSPDGTPRIVLYVSKKLYSRW